MSILTFCQINQLDMAEAEGAAPSVVFSYASLANLYENLTIRVTSKWWTGGICTRVSQVAGLLLPKRLICGILTLPFESGTSRPTAQISQGTNGKSVFTVLPLHYPAMTKMVAGPGLEPGLVS